MPLPSPVAEIPDFSASIQQNQALSESFMQSAWATLRKINQGNQSQTAMQQFSQAVPEGSAAPTGAYADDMSQWGFGDNVPRSLIKTESGGNWGAQNNETGSGGQKGHFGILQFGSARLDDAKRAGVIPQNMTPQQFKQSKPAQVAASNWHFSDIDSRIEANGLERYNGQSVGGVNMTPNGMRAIAHLGGFGGLQKYLKTNGGYNPSDSFGTSLSQYGQVHAS